MPVTVIETPGATNANSYQTVAEIDTYFGARVPTIVANLWLEAEPTDKDAAAVLGTKWMEALIRWTGYTTDVDQALSWPRIGMLKRNGRAYVPDTEIPRELKDAHAEFSLLLLRGDRLAESSAAVASLTSLKVGPISLGFDKDQTFKTTLPIISQAIIDLLVPSWIDYVNNGTDMNVELERA